MPAAEEQVGVIRKLEPQLVNQIAAGEVIERPASVVKELLENAIDAEAAQIDLELEDGGRKLIRVRDDGLGMSADDLALAVASHATSKIARADDLAHIATLGFRGEALASIAAVSHLTITTRRADELEAHALAVEGGRAGDLRVAGAAPGTTAEVRNLFFNVPARRKFLKTEATELGHIVEAVSRIALAYPQAALRLSHNGRVVYDLQRASDLRERIAAFFGKHLAEQLIEVRAETPVGRLWGLVAPPAESRASAKMQYLFVNGRYVRDRTLLHAVREAYRGLMEANRQPVVFLYLTVPPEDVDVNVHPTKIEVRLRYGQELYREVLAGLRERFLKADLAPRLAPMLQLHRGLAPMLEQHRVPAPAFEAAPPGAQPAQNAASAESVSDGAREERIRQSIADFMRAQPAGAAQQRFAYPPASRRAEGGPRVGFGPGEGAALPGTSRPPGMPSQLAARPVAEVAGAEEAVSAKASPQAPAGELRAMQLHNTYLVAETGEGILIVDQHALHERVLYEDLRRRMKAGPLESQRLLIPAVLDVTDRERAFLEEHRAKLGQLGIEFELFGPQSVGVLAFPSALGSRAQPERVLRDLLEWSAEHGGRATVEDVLDEVLHRMACHGAVKAGEALSPQEIQELLARRDSAEQTATCPHGRPTSLVLTKSEIERQFKRDYKSTRPQDDETILP